MLHIGDVQPPYHRHFDVGQVLEEFVDHISLLNDLSSKNAFVLNYNDWAQRSNILLRSLRETKNKWQEVSSCFQKYARARTFLFVLSCLVGLWEGCWSLALFPLAAHIFAESMRPALNAKVFASTHVKTPLRSIFLVISRMKRYLARIETKLEVAYNLPSTSTPKQKLGVDVFDESPCHHAQNVVPRLNIFPVVVSVLCGVIVLVAIHSVFIWTTEAFYSYFLSLLSIAAVVLATSYAVFAREFIKHSTAVRSELEAESCTFMKWFEDWITRANINIDFCHYKFCFLNLLHHEDRMCTVGDPYCAFLTMWFLTSVERLLRFAVRNGDSQATVSKLFSNIPVDNESFLNVQYAVSRLQNVLQASLPKSKLNLRNEVTISSSCTSKNNKPSPSEPASMSVFSDSTHSSNADHCALCTSCSSYSRHLENSTASNQPTFSGSHKRSLSLSRCVSGNSVKSGKSGRTSYEFPLTSIFTSSGSRVPGIDTNLETIPGFKRKSSLSSESIVSSVLGNCSSEILASESSISSKEQQRFKYTSSENQCHEVTGLGVSDWRIDQPDENSVPCSESVHLKPSAEKSSMRKCLQRHRKRSSQYNSHSVTSSKSSSEEIPKAEKILSDLESLSTIAHSNVPSANGNSISASNVELLTKHHRKVEDAIRAEEENSADERKRGKECGEESLNAPVSCESIFPLKDTSDSSFITGNQSISSETEKLENQEADDYIAMKIDLVSRSSNSDVSDKPKQCNAKCSSPSFHFTGLSVVDHDFNHCTTLMPALPDSNENMSEGQSTSTTSGVNGDFDHHRKGTEILATENGTFTEAQKSFSSLNCKDLNMEFLSSPIENEYEMCNQTVDTKYSVEDSVLRQLHFPGHLDGKNAPSVNLKHTKDFPKLPSMSDSSIPMNRNSGSSKVQVNGDYHHTYSHKAKSMENFASKNLAGYVVMPLPLKGISSASQRSGISPVPRRHRASESEEDSDELSFPIASSEDENFKFRPESGCTSDTLYSERQNGQDGPTIVWKSDSTKQRDPSRPTDPPKSDSETKPETSGHKGAFKFDNFDFGFDLNANSENLTLKFYCESEGENTESVVPRVKKKKHHCSFPKGWKPEYHYKVPSPLDTQNNERVGFRNSSCDRLSQSEHDTKVADVFERTCSPENHDLHNCLVENSTSDSESGYSCTGCWLLGDDNSNPCRGELKRAVEFDFDGIAFNFKRRKNSGPIKLQYHRRRDAKDFLFKSRFKRFRFRCGNSAPRSEPLEEREEQVPYESNYEEGHSENDSNF